MSLDSLRLMVVDDTGLYRKLLSDILSRLDGIEVVGTASNGRIALAQLYRLKPDLLTLDVEMPVMDGLETLGHLREVAPEVGAIMVSSLTKRGADVTVEALERGAFDFITKPEGRNPTESATHLEQQLQPLLQVFRTKARLNALMRGGRATCKPVATPRPAEASRGGGPIVPRLPGVAPRARTELLTIGLSTGGPQALARLIPHLPRGLGVPIVVTIHMPPTFTASLADALNGKSALTVVEASSGQVLENDTVYIAPGGKQMKVVRSPGQMRPVVAITDDPPEKHCKPSVDYLFRSVAELYGNRSLGVIMTGMGDDGVRGLRLMKEKGAMVMAQDEASCVVFGMPGEAVKAGVVDRVVSLDQMAQAICQHIQKKA